MVAFARRLLLIKLAGLVRLAGAKSRPRMRLQA